MTRSIIALPAAIAIIGGAALTPPSGAARPQLHRRPAGYSMYVPTPRELSQDERRWVRTHCKFDLPKPLPGFPHGPTAVVAHEGYVLELSLVDKVPLWVCEKVAAGQLGGDAVRRDRFQRDPLVPASVQAATADYTRTGYDRGHQAPAGNQTASQRLKDETFYLTNMAPQLPSLNRYIWRALETRAREWAAPDEPVYIITGGFFYDGNEDEAATADGLVEHYTIGPGGVSAPTHFYKIVLQRRGSQWRAIAFVLANGTYRSPYRLEDRIKSIDWIEQRVGFDFFSEMEDQQENALEGTPSPMWQ